MNNISGYKPIGEPIKNHGQSDQKVKTSAPKGGSIEERTHQLLKGIGEDSSKTESTTSTPIKTKFSETAKMTKYREESMKKFEEVGEKYGGTKRLNLKGMNYIVPRDPEMMEKGYQDVKIKVASRIKITEDGEHVKQSKNWKNGSSSIENLLKDAESLKSTYSGFLREIASKNNGEVHFGPDDMFITKSKSSLERKVHDDMKILRKSEGECVQEVGDSIRGTVVLKTPEDITNFIETFQEKCSEKKFDVTFKNIWKEERASGYVGVHAKVKLQTDEGRVVLAELQLHLPQIYNGTPACVKEDSHLIYEYGREAYGPESKGKLPTPPPFANQISKLQFLSHMLDIPQTK